jgi:ribosomal-protein-alanine N-acetyltransferase
VVLRPVQASDAGIRRAVRAANDSWLRPWNPSSSDEPQGPSRVEPFLAMGRRLPVWHYLSVARNRWQAWRGIAFTWIVWYGGQFAGELTVWHVIWGAGRTAEVGYWIDQRFAGLGITPTALAMGADHCFRELGLHRLEAGIQPENAASLRVVEKLRFRNEGIRVRLVRINGAWRDHICYAITAEEVPDGLLARWRSSLATLPGITDSRSGRKCCFPSCPTGDSQICQTCTLRPPSAR